MSSNHGDRRSFMQRITAARSSTDTNAPVVKDTLVHGLGISFEGSSDTYKSSSGSISTPRTIRPPSGWTPDGQLPDPNFRAEELVSTAIPKLPVSTVYCGLKPYSNFISEVVTYSSPAVQTTYPNIRDIMQRLCREKAIDSVNAFVAFPDDAIFPSESGSFLFVDHILQSNAAMCAFFTPDSKFVWFHFSLEPLVRPPLSDYIAYLVNKGELKPLQRWRPGQKQHKTLWEMARKACYYAEEDKRATAYERGVDTNILPYSHLAKGATAFNKRQQNPGQKLKETGDKSLYLVANALQHGWERPCSPIVPGGDPRVNEAITTEYTDGDKFGDVRRVPGACWIPPLRKK
jgi:hypothetical protein